MTSTTPDPWNLLNAYIRDGGDLPATADAVARALRATKTPIEEIVMGPDEGAGEPPWTAEQLARVHELAEAVEARMHPGDDSHDSG